MNIQSVLWQAGVVAKFSGAALALASGDIVVEGVRGRGDSFMLGQAQPEMLPDAIAHEVRELLNHHKQSLGHVRMEWAHDGVRPA